MFINGNNLSGFLGNLQNSFKHLASKDEGKSLPEPVGDTFIGAISDRSEKIRSNRTQEASKAYVTTLNENTESVVKSGQDKLHSVSSALNRLGSSQLQGADIAALGQILQDVSAEVKQVSEYSQSVDLQAAAQIIDQAALDLNTVEFVDNGSGEPAAPVDVVDQNTLSEMSTSIGNMITGLQEKIYLIDTTQGQQEATQAVEDLQTLQADMDAKIAAGEGLTAEDAAAVNAALADINAQLTQAKEGDEGSSRTRIEDTQASITAMQDDLTLAVSNSESGSGTTSNAVTVSQTDLEGMSTTVGSLISGLEEKISLIDTYQGRQLATQAVNDLQSIQADMDAAIAEGSGLTAEQAADFSARLDTVNADLTQAKIDDEGSSADRIEETQSAIGDLQAGLEGSNPMDSIQAAKDDLASVISSVEGKIALIDTYSGRQEATGAVADMREVETLLANQLASGESFTVEEADALNQQLNDISDRLSTAGFLDFGSSKDTLLAAQDSITIIQSEISGGVALPTVDSSPTSSGQDLVASAGSMVASGSLQVLQSIKENLQVAEKIFKRLGEGGRAVLRSEIPDDKSPVDLREMATFNLQSIRNRATDIQSRQEIAKQLLEGVLGKNGAIDIQNLAEGKVYSSGSVRQDVFLQLLDQNFQSRG